MNEAPMEIFFIGEGAGGNLPPDRVGSKAANLARVAGLGLRMPPAFVLGTQIYRWFTFAIERPQLDNLHDWYYRLRQRPGVFGRDGHVVYALYHCLMLLVWGRNSECFGEFVREVRGCAGEGGDGPGS